MKETKGIQFNSKFEPTCFFLDITLLSHTLSPSGDFAKAFSTIDELLDGISIGEPSLHNISRLRQLE